MTGFGDPPPGFDPGAAEDLLDALPEPEEESAHRHPPVEPLEREDPYDAFVHTFEAEASHGPLDGTAIAVKDNVAIRGVTATAGGALEYDPASDAPVVTRLRDAGADLVGTTTMDAFALGTTGEWNAAGRTGNPAVPGHVPGGSSAGSGAAVAGGLADAAIGTDTGGSVRIPASYCGVVGVKPTYGLVPAAGIVPLAPTLDHVGVLAGDVPTARAVLEAVAGRSPIWPASLATPAAPSLDMDPGDLTVGLIKESLAPATEAVAETVERALAGMDARVKTVACTGFDAATPANDAATLAEFAAVLSGAAPVRPGLRDAIEAVRAAGLPLPDRVRRLAFLGRALMGRPEAYARAWDARRRLVTSTEALFETVDVLATPTTPTTAPAFGKVTTGADVRETLRNTAPFDNTGQPAVSVPCGETDGRPVGLQFAAPAGQDGLALATAERVLNG